MKFVFNRDGEGIRNWDETNRALEKDLETVRSGKDCGEEELKVYLLKAVEAANVDEEKEYAFWEYAEPASMPADARCEYVYRPTYLMTLIMVNSINRYPGLMKVAAVEETLRFALNACTGRGMNGHGDNDYEGLCSNILLFMKNGIVQFMKNWPLFSIQFEGMFRNALNRIEHDYTTGKYTGDSWGSSCEEVQKAIVEIRHKTTNEAIA